LVGGPRDTTLSILIAEQVDLLDWPYAAALSATLLAATLLMIAAFQRLPGIGNAFTMSAR
jgi:ABC-type spermidine/putrescine transport system permease subunit I